MTTPQPGLRRARLAPPLLVAAVAIAVATAPVAGAADPSPGPASARPAVTAPVTPAAVTLTSADITGTTLALTGTVRNATTDPLTEVAVSLWRSTSPLHTPEAVAGALSAETTTPGTARVAEPTGLVLVTGPDDPFTPGATRPFTVSGSLDALGLTQADATWWVGADVSGRVAGARTLALGSARTLVSRPTGTIPVVEVVEFSARPRQVKDDLLTDDGLLTDITDGRLAALMDRAEAGGASWVVDPSLLLELSDMADGYRLRADDGSTAGTGGAAAEAWLARLAALPRPGATMLLGAPDLSAAADLRDDALLGLLRVAARDATEGLTAVTVVDSPDAASLAVADGLDRPVVAVDAEAPSLRVVADGVDALVAKTSTGVLPTSPLLPDTALNRRAARFAVARAAGGEVHWVRTEAEASAPDEALPQGFGAADLGEVLTGGAQPWAAPAAGTSVQALDAPRLARALALRAEMVAYGDAAPDAGVGQLADAQVVRAASRWWNDDPAALDAWLDALAARLATPGGVMVSLDATGRFSMTGATSEFPITVTNHLLDPVVIRLHAVSDNPQRIQLVTPDEVTVAPGASNTVLVQANAAGGGVVRATVHATTPSGHRLTPDREIVVETTNYGTIGWVIVVVSALVLVGTTAHRIRQVRAKGKGVG